MRGGGLSVPPALVLRGKRGGRDDVTLTAPKNKEGDDAPSSSFKNKENDRDDEGHAPAAVSTPLAQTDEVGAGKQAASPPEQHWTSKLNGGELYDAISKRGTSCVQASV